MTDQPTPVATYPLPRSARITLTDQVIVRVSGPGTDKFLQGQFSQQLTDVTPDHALRAAASTPKGRAYCLTRMVREGDDVLMAFPQALADGIIGHLKKYLMLFRGTTMEAEPSAEIIGLLGESAATALAGERADLLREDGDSVVLASGHLIKTIPTEDGLPRFEFWRTGDLNADTDKTLTQLPEESLATWHASEIAAGVPSLTIVSQESYVPQMLNWQHLGGVHFKKGCYTGQEVIARMHFLGQLKKSLYRISYEATERVPEPGTSLRLQDRTVGEVVNSVQYSDGHCEFLAVVRHDAAQPDIRLQNHPDLPLSILTLPYDVPEREKDVRSDT